MTCEFALKRNGIILCRCLNLAHGLINGKSVNVANPICQDNPDCYYKLWKRATKKEGQINE